MDVHHPGANRSPNLDGLLKTYGVEVQSLVVVEGDQNKVAAQNPLFVIPSLEYHDILSPLRTNKYDIVLIGAQAIQTLDLKKRTLKIEPLLTSSAKSYGKTDIANAKIGPEGKRRPVGAVHPGRGDHRSRAGPREAGHEARGRRRT